MAKGVVLGAGSLVRFVCRLKHLFDKHDGTLQRLVGLHVAPLAANGLSQVAEKPFRENHPWLQVATCHHNLQFSHPPRFLFISPTDQLRLLFGSWLISIFGMQFYFPSLEKVKEGIAQNKTTTKKMILYRPDAWFPITDIWNDLQPTLNIAT